MGLLLHRSLLLPPRTSSCYHTLAVQLQRAVGATHASAQPGVHLPAPLSEALQVQPGLVVRDHQRGDHPNHKRDSDLLVKNSDYNRPLLLEWWHPCKYT